tara:strand:+ start:75 stop:812 length:738 start_codon:yes stop_codon:yes gene_type:complete
VSKKKYTYSDKKDTIDQELRKRKNKWYLNSLGWFDFEDVEQIIRLHLFKKWEQWDQKRPLKPWINKIITNQLKNILRNTYTSFAKPCVGCPFNHQAPAPTSRDFFNDNLCSFTKSGLQCDECPLYAKWEKRKQSAYNVKMPLAMEHHAYELSLQPTNDFDLDAAGDKLHGAMKEALSPRQYRIYKMLFIDYLEEEEIAEKMGYRTTERGRKAGYKQLKNLKKQFKEKATHILKNSDIIIHDDTKR